MGLIQKMYQTFFVYIQQTGDLFKKTKIWEFLTNNYWGNCTVLTEKMLFC